MGLTKKAKHFDRKPCAACGQTTEYLVGLDKGAAYTVIAFYAAVRRKGLNCLHPAKEMLVMNREWTPERCRDEGVITPQMRNDLKHAGAHGLIAKVRGEPGNWCLTRKGAEFLRGARIPKYAVLSKTEGKQIGYWEPDGQNVTIADLLKSATFWDPGTFEIREGRIVPAEEKP